MSFSTYANVRLLLTTSIWSTDIRSFGTSKGYHGQTGERPDGATLIPWTRGKPLAWDITIANTYANSYVNDTATREAADRAVPTKTTKYTELSKSHHFTSIVIEMGGSWNDLDIEFITELGGRITAVTQEP